MDTLVIADCIGNLSTLPNYEDMVQDGDSIEVRIYLMTPLDQEAFDQIEYDLCSQGVKLTGPIVQGARILVIPFQKEPTTLNAIAATVQVLVTGWQLVSPDAEGISQKTLIGIVIATVVGGALFMRSRRS